MEQGSVRFQADLGFMTRRSVQNHLHLNYLFSKKHSLASPHLPPHNPTALRAQLAFTNMRGKPI